VTRYALLILPSANRVYADAAVGLTRAELELFGRSVLKAPVDDVDTTIIGGVPYVTFGADDLDPDSVAMLSNLSSIYALYQVEDGLLRPVELRPLDRFDDDLITIQKYAGKTNEQFTKLLLNATLLASRFASDFRERRFSVIDPLCGRGTTLNQALMYGFDAAGIDRDQKDFEAYATFIQTWLKRKRLKHQADAGPVRRNRQVVARRLQVTLAESKEQYKAGETQHLDVVNADTTKALEFFRPGTFDLVVADAPYGVQHGSRVAGRERTRSPLELVLEAAPVWAALLRSGGALGLAWNTHVARRDALASALVGAGLVVSDGPSFAHRVDQSIVRDIIVASKA
jgi:hypothetical protein